MQPRSPRRSPLPAAQRCYPEWWYPARGRGTTMRLGTRLLHCLHRAGLRAALMLVLLVPGLLWPSQAPALAAPPPAISGLHASGNQILNASGQPVRLRGVNRTSGEYACIQGWGIFEGATDDTA